MSGTTYSGALIFDTKISTKNFQSGIKDIDRKTNKANDIFVTLKKSIVSAFNIKVVKDFGEEVEKTEKEIGSTNDTIKGLARGIAMAFSVRAVKDFLVGLAETSSALKALDSQFEQVFKGEESKQALKLIQEQSDDLKIHVDLLKSSFSSFGAQVKGAGMESKKALEATALATKLAADSAAFYDTNLQSATSSVASFMKGNFEAGDAIGVFTNAKQMDARANEMYSKSWDKLSESERQWLLLDTIDKTYQLNGAAGQATREQDNWANVTANLTAVWQRFLEIVGTPVLSGLTVSLQGITTTLGGLVELMQRNPEATKTFINLILGFLSGLVTYLAVRNASKLVVELAKGFDIFGKTLPTGKIMLTATALLTLIQLAFRLHDAWGKMTFGEQLIASFGLIAAAAFSAAMAVGAFQTVATMGAAAAAIGAGILAVTLAIAAAESRAKQTQRSNSYSGGYSSSGYSTMNVPKLATGAVIPPNSEFLAILGDQKHGTNIEAPLSTIEQAMDNVLSRRGYSGGGGGAPIIIQLDGREVARVIAPYNAGESARQGVRLIDGVI
ncbi:MAG: hypothetical protein ACK5MV_07650 [Aminipila sp.]